MNAAPRRTRDDEEGHRLSQTTASVEASISELLDHFRRSASFEEEATTAIGYTYR